jgi:hypothetical protein
VSDSSSVFDVFAISSIAVSKASELAAEGLLNPLNLRTNCTAAARISSSLAGGAKLCSCLMFRHIIIKQYQIGAFFAFARNKKTKEKNPEFAREFVSIGCFSLPVGCFSLSVGCFSASNYCFSVSDVCFSLSVGCFPAGVGCFSASVDCFFVSDYCFFVTVDCFPASVGYFPYPLLSARKTKGGANFH